jgi:hypothetical protein
VLISKTKFVSEYKCIEAVGRYLVYNANLPVLRYDENGYYYFRYNNELEKAIGNLPFYLKIRNAFSSQVIEHYY